MIADQNGDEFGFFDLEPVDDFPVFFDDRSFGFDENEIRFEVENFFFPGLVSLFFGDAVSPEDLMAGLFDQGGSRGRDHGISSPRSVSPLKLAVLGEQRNAFFRRKGWKSNDDLHNGIINSLCEICYTLLFVW